MGECFLYGQNIESTYIKKTLEESTWEEINEISQSGKASEYWQIGDTKDIVVSGETLTVEIMDFNHDDLTGGGKAGITFGLKNLMANLRHMNNPRSNVGGFTGSEMYAWLQGDLLSSLPSDLQSVIKTVNKKTSAGNQSSTINTNAMKIFLFSEVEICGATTHSFAGEGEQYPIFATTSNRIKYLSNGSGSVFEWWERSPVANNSKEFCRVSSDGSSRGSGMNFSIGVCFGFCV